MKTSIATVSLSGNLVEKLEAIARAGFAGAEIFENDLLNERHSAAEIGRIMRDLGIECTMFQPFRDLEGMPGEERDAAFRRLQRKFGVMDELGTDLVLVCSNCSPGSLGERERLIADLAAATELAFAAGKRIAYEALAWGRHVNDHRDAWSLVRDVDHPALGLALDSFHSLARGIPNSSIGDIRPEKLFIVQIADAPALEMDSLSWSRHFRAMPGQGDLPLTEFAAAIERLGYNGYWSLEIFNDHFRAGSTSQVAADGYRSLRLLEDDTARILGKPGQMPPKVEVSGVEFIEFAASHLEGEEFAAIFTALGFAPTARHRNKDVTRWQQGDINLVLNCEPEGHAHSHDIVHGASVCALGLAVRDQQDALRRAEALRIPRLEQAVRSDEWEIPSLVGVGGSLLYLVDAETRATMWSDEFPRTVHAGMPTELLATVDHVAQTMHHAEFLSWLLCYVSLLNVEKTAQLELADPKGLVHSQAVQTADRSIRITLNGSLAQQSLTSRFLRNYFGSGVQHVAFASHDIFATAEYAREHGLRVLEIGPNYYADIEARFGLEPEFVARMQRLNILYDRCERGEYLQFYSRAIAKRIFFEVVERRDYDDFGAANAGVRLSAQSLYREQEWV